MFRKFQDAAVAGVPKVVPPVGSGFNTAVPASGHGCLADQALLPDPRPTHDAGDEAQGAQGLLPGRGNANRTPGTFLEFSFTFCWENWPSLALFKGVPDA